MIAVGLLAGACKAIDPEQDFAEYENCVVYSYDSSTGDGVATDYARINVTGDMASGLFSLEFVDFKLTRNGNVATAKVNGLMQYLHDVTDEQNQTKDVLYTYFYKEGNTFAEGDMQVANLRFGWLSTVYWGSFTSDNGRVRVWTLPREVETYANRNSILNERDDQLSENALSPRYMVEINTHASTVTIRATGVKLPADVQEPHTKFEFRNLLWENLPVRFNDRGFTIDKPTFSFVSDNGRFTVTDFRCTFCADYESERTLEYTIHSEASGETLRVKTTLDYFKQKLNI